MKTGTTLPNQSLLDIILTEYGSMEAGMKVAAENDMEIGSVPLTESVVLLPEVAEDNVDLPTIEYLRRERIVLGTAYSAGLGYHIALRPRIFAVPNEVGDPHVMGYYRFEMQAAVDFSHINPIEADFPGGNRLYYQTEERYIMGLPPENAIPEFVTPMSAIVVPYKLPWTVGFGYMMTWSDLSAAHVTTTYRDIAGNVAYVAPVTIFDNTTNTVVERLLGDLTLELLSSAPSTVTIRLTRSHPTIGLANFSSYSMDWLDAAATGSPDPEDPGNPDKTVLTLNVGVHKVGLKTIYMNPAAGVIYPASAFTMIIIVE